MTSQGSYLKKSVSIEKIMIKEMGCMNITHFGNEK